MPMTVLFLEEISRKGMGQHVQCCARNVREYVALQRETWRKIPGLALWACWPVIAQDMKNHDGPRPDQDWETAYIHKLWPIWGPGCGNGHPAGYVDLITGQLVSAYQDGVRRPFSDENVAKLITCSLLLDADKIADDLKQRRQFSVMIFPDTQSKILAWRTHQSQKYGVDIQHIIVPPNSVIS